MTEVVPSLDRPNNRHYIPRLLPQEYQKYVKGFVAFPMGLVNSDDVVDMPASGSSFLTTTPPPEPPSFTWTRRLVIISFWTVVALGLPHWIWTTSIHRSVLPLEAMNKWADGDACELRYPVYIRLVDSDSHLERGKDFTHHVAQLLRDQNHAQLYTFHLLSDAGNSSVTDHSGFSKPLQDPVRSHQHDTLLTVNLRSDTKAKSTEASLRSLVPVLDIRHNPERSVDSATLAPFVASEILKVFEHDAAVLQYLLGASSFGERSRNEQLSSEVKADLDARSTRAFKYASTYHLTFSLFSSVASPSAWDIDEALQESIQPLLDRMSSISRFTVDTQVQLHASFSPTIAGPQYDPSTLQWKLQKSDLSSFINAAEWPLNPGIGSGPTINFVLYVPAKHQSPLVIAETGGQSWLIPQWGGAQIHNPSNEQSDRLTADHLRPVMLTFAEQLASLVGLPQRPTSLSLRVASLTRERATSLILSASSTLGALARLTLKLKSIAIPGSVAGSVDETIRRLDRACLDIQEGRYHAALESARTAEEEAEKAFFEPSMVGQVYFPDEHKVAVYVPLLGPMAVPLVLAVVKELRKLRLKKEKTA